MPAFRLRAETRLEVLDAQPVLFDRLRAQSHLFDPETLPLLLALQAGPVPATEIAPQLQPVLATLIRLDLACADAT